MGIFALVVPPGRTCGFALVGRARYFRGRGKGVDKAGSKGVELGDLLRVLVKASGSVFGNLGKALELFLGADPGETAGGDFAARPRDANANRGVVGRALKVVFYLASGAGDVGDGEVEGVPGTVCWDSRFVEEKEAFLVYPVSDSRAFAMDATVWLPGVVYGVEVPCYEGTGGNGHVDERAQHDAVIPIGSVYINEGDSVDAHAEEAAEYAGWRDLVDVVEGSPRVRDYFRAVLVGLPVLHWGEDLIVRMCEGPGRLCPAVCPRFLEENNIKLLGFRKP